MVVSRDGAYFCVDAIVLLASGQQLVARGVGGDAHSAFDIALAKIETRVRRYKRRLKNHHPHLGGAASQREAAPYVVLRAPTDDDTDTNDEWGADGSAGPGAPAAAIIAETEKSIRTLTVSMAVLELDLSGGAGGDVPQRRPRRNRRWSTAAPTATSAGSIRSAPVATLPRRTGPSVRCKPLRLDPGSRRPYGSAGC